MDKLIVRLLRQLRKIAPSGTKPFALWYEARSSRAFFVLPSRRYAGLLHKRAEQAIFAKWKGPFEPKIYA